MLGAPCYRWIAYRLKTSPSTSPAHKALFQQLRYFFLFPFSPYFPATCNVCFFLFCLFCLCVTILFGEDKWRRQKKRKNNLNWNPKTGIYGQPKRLDGKKGHAWRGNSKSKWTWWIGAGQVFFIFIIWRCSWFFLSRFLIRADLWACIRYLFFF